jgi:LPXTG-motif cell wall-anchored protein
MRAVPSVCRGIAALLAVACLGASAPVTAALAQGAGDQQYQDPFGDSGSGSSGSSGSGGSKTQTNPRSTIKPLSPSPQTAGGGSSGGASSPGASGSASGGAAATPAAPQARTSLPNTGLDTRALLLAGAVLLILGLGLRLRSAPERF